ncbi:hypothetical protein BX600DRAFT_45482 [Xylariales sp. PMI_506]|nr:hypothetical protein BX600DRAFT_45482 [Xylariales sp. PMI_506]
MTFYLCLMSLFESHPPSDDTISSHLLPMICSATPSRISASYGWGVEETQVGAGALRLSDPNQPACKAIKPTELRVPDHSQPGPSPTSSHFRLVSKY